MFRFLRRVFIILILLIIVFFVFRLVKPEATNRFVDKVRGIPTTISSRFHREKKSNIIINGNTTSTSSNFEINNEQEDDGSTLYIENTTENNEYSNNGGNTEDLARLEELNRELDKILQSGNNETTNEEDTNDDNLGEIISGLVNDNNIQISEITGNDEDTEFVVIDVEQPYEPEEQTTTTTQTNNSTTTNNNNTTNNNQSNNSTSNNTTSTRQQGDCGEGLSVQDCQEMYNIFGNLNID